MTPEAEDSRLIQRAADILQAHQRQIHGRTDRMFAVLMVVQWLAAVVAAICLSPRSWSGATSSVHPHVWLAAVMGGLLCVLPVFLASRRPGQAITRHTIAIAQVLFSSLLIHISGGRIETHFHVFGSLAFLAAYRDWKVLLPATVVVAADHIVRGLFWPQTVFGILTASPWRWVEHAGWVVFEDVFLLIIIRQSMLEMRATSLQTACLERNHAEQQEFAERVARSSERERAVIEGALDAVVQMDSAGRVIGWNGQAERTFGWTAAEILGQRVGDLIVPEKFRAAHDQGLRVFLETGQGPALNQRLELEALHRDGRTFPVEFAVTPMRGTEITFCAFLRDITDRRRHENELRQAKDQAEAASRTKSAFLANVSHEIRTPLNGILGFTELLLRNADGGDEHERRDYLTTIRTSGKHLLDLINDILDLSKIEAGQMQIERTDCSPHQLIAEVVSVLRVRAQEKGVSLDYRWDSLIPETIQSDPYRLRQLLMNLIGNAIKFTDRGSVHIVSRIAPGSEGSRWMLEFRDSGIGISEAQQQTIFHPFVQADSSTTRRYGGTGLGLSICKNIVEALGGAISVESRLGEGSTFYVEIPTGDLRDVRTFERPPAGATGDIVELPTGLTQLQGVRVLLADDGETNRKLIRLFLSREGAHVEAVENGALAVDAATAQTFDVVLMDMQMPVMDGYAATRKLRDAGYTGPILALTAHAMKGDREKCEAAGCSGHISKPVNMDELLREVRAAGRLAAGAAAVPTSADVPIVQTTAALPALKSSLPTSDPAIREIVAEFADGVAARIDALVLALADSDFAALEQMAHGLKGAGGTAGYAPLSNVSARLEDCARRQQPTDAAESIEELRKIERRMVV